VLAFVDAIEAQVPHVHGFVLVRHGAVVAEGYWLPFRADEPHQQFSLSKSVTSTAVGLLVAEGGLSLDDSVLDLFPDLAPRDPSPRLRAMRVRHLLTMTAGHDQNPLGAMRTTGPEWTRSFLSQPLEHDPGTQFVYSDAASYTLSAVVQRVTGTRLSAYLRPRLLDPLGVEHLEWLVSPEGVEVGGWEMYATTDEVARFGQLFRQRGRWRGRQVVPEAWIEEATAYQVPSLGIPGVEWARGYGYNWWRCSVPGGYRADGAFGQLCLVLPEQDLVLAINSGAPLNVYGQLMAAAWEHLLPALHPAPLPTDPKAEARLRDRLATLRLPTVDGQPTASVASTAAGRTFAVAENPDRISTIRFDRADEGWSMTLGDDRGETSIRCGYEDWEVGEGTSLLRTMYRAEPNPNNAPPHRLAASGAWTDERTYTAQIWWTGTAFGRRLVCRFKGDGVVIDQQQNVSFGPVGRARLEGTS
jgi:CubicO group peptidase (beta-lactamase class C family)